MYSESTERSRSIDYYYLAKTKEEEETLLDELSYLYESLYRATPNAFEEALDKGMRHEVANLVRQDLRQGDKAIFIKGLISKIKGRHKVMLTLAISPTDYFIEKIYDWLVKNVSEDIVIDISIDKSLLGGAIISFEGKYFDYTLWKTLKSI